MSVIQSVIAKINGQSYTLTYNNATGAYEASVTAPTETSYHVNDGHYYPVEITATDISGNSTTINDTDSKYGSSLRLRVKETVKPTIQFVTPTADAGLTNNKPTIKVNVKDTGAGIDLSTFRLSVGADILLIADCTYKEITEGYEITYTPVSALADGSHTIKANVSDNDGNAATEVSISIKIDTVPPTLTILTPTNNTFVNTPGCTVSGVTNDATSSPVTVEIAVNGSAVGSATVNADGSFSKLVTLSNGENSIVITATDALGKSTSVTRIITLDTSAPEFTSVSITPNPVNAGATYTISVKITS